MRSAIAAILLCLCLSVAEARTAPPHSPITFDHRHDLSGYVTPTWSRSRIIKRSAKRDAKKQHRRTVAHKGTIQGYGRHIAKTASLDAVVAPLAAKARELIASCGAKVISGYRPGARIAGSRGVSSLHARFPAEAVDMTGDTSCIYPKMKGWPGGYSVDYAAVRHIHISLASDRRERGVRFTHYGTRRYARAR